MKPVISLRGVGKSYRVSSGPGKEGSFATTMRLLTGRGNHRILWALRGIDLDVSAGEILGVIGPNGAGKSTLLMILAGILPPSEGRVEVEGNTSQFFQVSAGLQERLTVLENFRLCAALMGIPKKRFDEKFDEVLAFSELEDYLHARFGELSSGLAARVAFSMALCADQDIVLVDEMLAVGDIAFQRKCREMFKEFRRSGKTMVIVSHGMEMISELADKALYLHGGEIRDYGETQSVVRGYVGAMGSFPRKEDQQAQAKLRMEEDLARLEDKRRQLQTVRDLLHGEMRDVLRAEIRKILPEHLAAQRIEGVRDEWAQLADELAKNASPNGSARTITDSDIDSAIVDFGGRTRNFSYDLDALPARRSWEIRDIIKRWGRGDMDPAFLEWCRRDPNRRTPEEKGLLLAPADGFLHVRETDSDYVLRIYQRFTDPQIVRAPLSGRVRSIRLEGKGYRDLSEEGHLENRQIVTELDTEIGLCTLRQIMSWTTINHETFIRAGEKITAGQKIGRLTIGMSVLVQIPKRDVELFADEKQTLAAGETILARYRAGVS